MEEIINRYGVILIILVMLIAVAALAGWYILWIRMQKERKKHELIAAGFQEMEMKIQSLELENIKSKLNPHLFKNTLNAIQSHAYQTYYALDKLGNVLDFILYESDQQFVSLKEEVEFSLSLIEINRLKVSPLFDLRIKKKLNEEDPVYHQKLVSPLISIHLIENAFKHADFQSADAFISVVFELKEYCFYLTVSNKISNTPALKKPLGGFGKKSFEKRLDIIYGKHYKLDQFVEEDVYIAQLKINLLEHKAEMLTVG